MGANTNGQFREDELVTRRMKVNGEWQTRTFPVVGGRLRLAHESNERLSIQTQIVRMDPDMVVAKATVETEKGRFNGTGTASAQRDQRLADALVELAETRAIARALRFGGFGVEYCSAEEISHVSDTEPSSTANKSNEPAGGEETGKGPNQKLAQRCANYGRATTAQVRALHALTKKAQYSEDDIDRLLAPLNAARFLGLWDGGEGLTRSEGPFSAEGPASRACLAMPSTAQPVGEEAGPPIRRPQAKFRG